jgi:hypothetical protein
MDERAKHAVSTALVWCGPIFVISFIYLFGILGHNLPPPNMMAMSAEQLVSEHYGKYPEIATGMIGCATFGLFYMAWSCQLASMLKDENGGFSVFGMMELAGGLLTGWLLAFCPAMWAACSLLAGQVDPGIIKMVHTMTWFIFDCTYMITTVQMIGLGLYTVLNKQQTIFPAWAGWTCMAIGVAFVALVIMPFVKEGPFAVGGLWNFWIIFSAWLWAFFSVYTYYMFKHLRSTRPGVEAVHGRQLPA